MQQVCAALNVELNMAYIVLDVHQYGKLNVKFAVAQKKLLKLEILLIS